MISINKVSKSYGPSQVLRDLSLEVEKGQIYGLLGVNGGGKTTLINCIAHEHKYNGSISYGELDFNQWMTSYKRRFAVIHDTPISYEQLTVKEYIKFVFGALGADYEQSLPMIEEIAIGLGLSSSMNKLTCDLSFGSKRKAYMLPFLVVETRLLIMDEPTNGLDTQSRIALKNFLRRKANEGCAIFLSSHEIGFLQGSCDIVGILSEGSIKRIVEKIELDQLEDIYCATAGLTC